MLIRCSKCKRAFVSYASRIAKGKGKYCSRECAHLARTKICTCPVCGKKWVNPMSQKGDKYCSRECYEKATGIQDCTCEVCHKKFHPNQQTKKNRFCSQECCWSAMRLPADVRRRNRLSYTKTYRQAHPEWTQAAKSRTRARKHGISEHFTPDELKQIKAAQEFKCASCSKTKKLTVDHIIPLSKGGSNLRSNIQALCGACNTRKLDHLPA